MKIDVWQEKCEKITKFFGPGVTAQIDYDDDTEKINLTLIVDRVSAPVTSPA